MKKFITIFFVSIILLSFTFSYFRDGIEYVIAATVNGLEAKGAINKIENAATIPRINGTAVAETTRKPVGHKMQNAEYHDELWDKYSVIAAEDGGGNGKGGGANSKNSQVVGNGGNYDEVGGILGGDGGELFGDSGVGNSGSNIADALRQLKAQIDASHEASVANEIAERQNKQYLKESIAAAESIQASIQRQLQQEIVKQSIARVLEEKQLQQTMPNYDYKVYKPEPNRIVTEETYVPSPTAFNADVYDDNMLYPIIMPNMVREPVSPVEEMQAPMITETVMPESKFEYYDAPIVEASPNLHMPETDPAEPIDAIIESSIAESLMLDQVMQAQALEASIAESIEEQNVTIAPTETEGAGGGENPEEDVDKRGDMDTEENSGDAKDKGLLQLEKENEYKGKKIFEIETTGNLGLHPDFISLLSTKTVMLILSSLLFIIGILLYTFGQFDRKNKKNYF